MDYSITMKNLLLNLIDAEGELKAAETRKKREELALNSVVVAAKLAAAKAVKEIEDLMAAHGVVEEIVEGKATDYKIGYRAGKFSVKVVDEKAVPKEFMKVEETPKLTDIMKHLQELELEGQAKPNWATIVEGKRTLTWKPIKKKVKNDEKTNNE